ncbi:hypothetical protein HYQ40_08350 [Aerococcaceae bacterium DSM 111021]|nr:hypothetical protein [Aerococcaceae bacterium DSM 111021]
MKKLVLLASLLLLGSSPVSAKDSLYTKEDFSIFEKADTSVIGVDEHDTGLLTVDMEMVNIISDKSAIEGFGLGIYMFLTSDDLPDIPNGVVFRGYPTEGTHQDTAVAVYYYNEETANRDWNKVNISGKDIYKLTDYISVVSPFSSYLENYSSTMTVDEDDPIDNALMRMTTMPKPQE